MFYIINSILYLKEIKKPLPFLSNYFKMNYKNILKYIVVLNNNNNNNGRNQ